MTTLPHDEVIPILDFGSQTAQLIARRVREAGAFSLLVRPDIPVEELKAMNLKGIIFSGGPSSVYEKGAPTCDPEIFKMGIPVLGICYGMQLGCQMLGAGVSPAKEHEYGRAHLHIVQENELLNSIPEQCNVWMSHGDQLSQINENFDVIATTPTCPYAAVKHKELDFYGVQFHPEVTHTAHGSDMLHNFIYHICNCKNTWQMSNFLDMQIKLIREQVGDKRVVCGLSGGVDSSVVAALLAKAIGKQLTCIFVDNGLLRKNECDLVENTFRDHFDIDLRVVDASEAFLKDLEGVTEPQKKRTLIGHRFIDVFKEESKDLEGAEFLAQGTLYPDVIESGHGHAGTSANIKLHHNVGGLPEELGFQLVEPLRDLFKDEVRKLGIVLGLTEEIVWRHPFPGPGLAVRITGEITKERCDLLREADAIVLEELHANNLYRSTSQVFAVLLANTQAVGVMGDGRRYDSVIAVRAVETQDFMTADWARLPYDVLATTSNRIINEVRGVSRVVYDISSKPPATIEWE